MNRGKSEMKKQKKDAGKQNNVMDKKLKKAEEKKAGGKNPVAFYRRISFRLSIGFLVPVIFIIILGVVSYNKASSQIIESYEISAGQTMSMINRYLSLAIDTVQSDYKGYMNDETLQKFFKGLLDRDEKHSYIPRQYQTDLNTAINTNNLIDNVYFLSDSQTSITTTQTSDPMVILRWK